MGDVVNLRRARKAKARDIASKQASENRSHFGRSRAEREAADARRDLEARRLDAHRREELPVPGDGDAG